MPLVKPEAEKGAPVGRGICDQVLEVELLRNLGRLGLEERGLGGGFHDWVFNNSRAVM